jgi:hypothetical protein
MKNDDIHRGCTDVAHTDAKLPFIGLQNGIGTRQRFEDRVFHINPGTVHHGNDVLDGTGGGCDDMHLDIELTTYHSDRKGQCCPIADWEKVADLPYNPTAK